MRGFGIWLRSLLFNFTFFPFTAFIAVVALPLLAVPRQHLLRLLRGWARGVLWLLRHVVGARVVVTGREHLPEGAAVVAAKHQSAFDTIVWLLLVPDCAYIMKKELLRIPLYGLLVRHAGMIPVDREGGGPALRRMLRATATALAERRQVVIFPEGTRTVPGERAPYFPGVVALASAAQAADAPVVPVATDSGRVWGRRAFRKRAGTIHITVLPPLPPGLPRAEILPRLEAVIEAESDRLLEVAGCVPARQPCG
jgi:1-acyl-sn-glycerol-3-phosphate acyltransferase